MFNYNVELAPPKAPQVYITRNHNRYKLYDNNQVFLTSNSNFEIEIYNPNMYKIALRLTYEGKLMSDNKLVILPGQRIFLDRFLDTSNKFLFKTYDIESNTKEAKDILQNNESLTIECFKENLNPYTPNYTFTTNHTLWNTPNYPKYTYFGDHTICGTGTIPVGNGNNLFNKLEFGSISNLCNKVETGIIEKDSKLSDQSLTSDTSTFYPTSFSTLFFQLKPESQVEYEKIKLYCHECGVRIRNNNWKFCPSCGTKY